MRSFTEEECTFAQLVPTYIAFLPGPFPVKYECMQFLCRSVFHMMFTCPGKKMKKNEYQSFLFQMLTVNVISYSRNISVLDYHVIC